MPPTSVLSDGTIRALIESGRVKIEPWDPGMVQPASVDVRLGSSFRVFHNHRAASIDLRDPPTNLTEGVEVQEGQPFIIHPGEFVLGRTMEWVELPQSVLTGIPIWVAIIRARSKRPRAVMAQHRGKVV
jgi:dCTP deaminase